MERDRRFIPVERVTQAPAIEIRPATVADVEGIAALVQSQARQGNLLPRPAAAIYDSIGDWIVAAVPAGDGPDEILGCVSLLPYRSGLVEVRSLAVQAGTQGLGIGSRMMDALLAEARRRGIPRLFALTRVVSFFRRFGFSITGKEAFPEKVWHDCWQCPLLEACDETAVVLEVGGSKD